MDLRTKLPIKDSIATKMLLVVLSLYLLIAIGVTLSHVVMEYRYQKTNIIQDLGDIESAFENGLAVSLWGLDEQALNASVKGILKIPTVIGIKVNTVEGATIAIGGIVTEDGETGDVGFHINLSGLGSEERAVHDSELGTHEMFERQFPIIYNLEGQNKLLGQATIYSNGSVIYRKMKLQVVMLAVNVVLTLLTFAIALLWVVNRYLHKPLRILTNATANISLSSLESFSVDTRISGRNEIKTLEKTITLMVSDLHAANSKREETEKELRKSEAHLRTLVRTLPDLVWLKDSDGVYLTCNPKFECFFGARQDEIVGKTDYDFVDKELADFFREKDKAAMAAGIPSMNEEEITYADDGHTEFLETIKTPIFDRHGKITGILGVGRDISERKEAEKALAAEKERLRVTLRSIGDGVITTDTEGTILFINKIAEKLTGWSNENSRGKPFHEVFNILNEKTGQKCASPISRVLELGRIVGLANHTALIAKDGTQVSIADSGAPIRDRESKIIGVVVVFRDITHERRIEEELIKIKKLESVGVLAGGIAHDFNNILSAILGNIELASFRIEDDDKTRSLLSDAQKATKRATKLTQQLLTFSKGGEPVKEKTSLNGLIQESADFVLHGSQVVCKYVFPDDLWMVDADSGQLGQVIQNIILNAKHAMPEGGKIKISCCNVEDAVAESLLNIHDERFVCIRIQDAGIGIPSEILDKIFDPYYTTKKEGSGLGLAICHSIINKHDGHITVQSSPGKGTTFTIYLPAALSTETTAAKVLQTSPAVKAARIMVMDDDKMICEVAQAQLTTLGHEVVLVADGERAINKYQELQDSGMPVDLVIMDLTIPGGMGGQEAAHQLLQLDPEAKIIVASGYSNDPVMANYRKYGFCTAIAKPFDLNELRKCVEFALS